MLIYGNSDLKTSLARISARCVDSLWPPCCAYCKNPVDQQHMLCATCWERMPTLSGDSCRFCGTPVVGDYEPLCQSCYEIPRPWTYGHAAAQYDGLARDMILSLKNGGKESYAPILAKLIYQRNPRAFSGLDALTAMPLHWRRLLSRGYNQAGLLCGNLCKIAHIPFEPRLITRKRHTQKQGKHADFEKRFLNLSNALSVPSHSYSKVQDKRIGIIDDVMTSGASLHYATEALLHAGAEEVRVFVFARAGNSD